MAPSTHNAPAPVVGIDLGTTNSLVAIVRAGAPVVLGDGADRLVPSVVRYTPDGARAEAVGRWARAHAVEFPERTIASVKRLMGRSLDDARADLPYLSYRVAHGPNRTARVVVGERLLSPPEVSGAILRELKDRASRELGAEVSRAVITVPAYFDDAQRQATRDAARLAGLNAIRIVNEPTAAALAYGVGLNLKKPATIAVYDLGGGTFDISILRVTPSLPSEPRAHASGSPDPSFFEVLATAGDTHLGGDDADHLLLALLLKEMREQGLLPPDAVGPESIDRSTMQALRQFAEATKVRLSTESAAPVRIDAGGGRFFERTITRAEFESLIRGWAERTITRCQQALRDAHRTPADIDTVVLVGGSTRIPLIRSLVAEFFGKQPYTALDPDLVVAMGAAVQASLLEGSRAGAPVSALLLDVLPLSLGVETIGGGVAKLIVRNSTVPARAVEMFSTSVDGQTAIKLNIVQGEREMVSDCRSLGVFHLAGIPPMPAGMPQVEVEFLVDANGVLNVSAHERRSGARAALQVVPNHGLTREEVERIERESLSHAREDMTRHRIADLVVNARMDIKWVRDALNRVRATLDPAYAQRLDAAIASLESIAANADRDWKSIDPDAFHRAKEALDRESMRLHEVAITESLRRG